MFGFFFLFLVVIAGLLGLMAGLKYLGVPFGPEVPPGALGREDIARLEEALGALDARLDRLEDQQKFLEGLLESRPEPPSLPPGSEPEAVAEPERGVDSVLFDVEREDR
jgi:hypothetical protein